MRRSKTGSTDARPTTVFQPPENASCADIEGRHCLSDVEPEFCELHGRQIFDEQMDVVVPLRSADSTRHRAENHHKRCSKLFS